MFIFIHPANPSFLLLMFAKQFIKKTMALVREMHKNF